MRLAPIVLVLLTSFALVTAARVDVKERMAVLSKEIVEHKKEIDRYKTDPTVVDRHTTKLKVAEAELGDRANADARRRIRIMQPQNDQEDYLLDFHDQQAKRHEDEAKKLKTNVTSLETLVKHGLFDENHVNDTKELAVATANYHRHDELKIIHKEQRARARLFFAQR
jgi:hypothetical protein